MPPGPDGVPVAMAVHATSAGTRDATQRWHPASFLPARGVATFVYDRRQSNGLPVPV